MKEMIDVQQLIHIIRNMKPCFLDGEMSGRITFKGDIDFATEADFAVQRQAVSYTHLTLPTTSRV